MALYTPRRNLLWWLCATLLWFTTAEIEVRLNLTMVIQETNVSETEFVGVAPLIIDHWIEAIITHVPPKVTITVYLRGRDGDQLLTSEIAADIDTAKAIAHDHARKHGIANEYVSFQERNRSRLK
jgi:hypothetical protein